MSLSAAKAIAASSKAMSRASKQNRPSQRSAAFSNCAGSSRNSAVIVSASSSGMRGSSAAAPRITLRLPVLSALRNLAYELPLIDTNICSHSVGHAAGILSRGVEVSEIFHLDGGRVPGPDPNHASYMSYTTFRDPDGNSWLLQEVTTRLPGRVWDD